MYKREIRMVLTYSFENNIQYCCTCSFYDYKHWVRVSSIKMYCFLSGTYNGNRKYRRCYIKFYEQFQWHHRQIGKSSYSYRRNKTSIQQSTKWSGVFWKLEVELYLFFRTSSCRRRKMLQLPIILHFHISKKINRFLILL